MAYEYKYSKTALGTLFEFKGPGLGQYASGVHLNVHGDDEASTVCRLLEQAFEAGKNARSVELLDLLGIRSTPWGIEMKDRKR